MLVLAGMVHRRKYAQMGSVPPHPSQVAALRCRSNGLLLPGCVLPGTSGGSRAPSPERPP